MTLVIKKEEEKEKRNKEEEKLLEVTQMARDDWFVLLDHSASVSYNWGKSGRPHHNPISFIQASAQVAGSYAEDQAQVTGW